MTGYFYRGRTAILRKKKKQKKNHKIVEKGTFLAKKVLFNIDFTQKFTFFPMIIVKYS